MTHASPTTAPDILIVDDEADIRMAVGGILQDEGFAIREAGSAEQALEQVKTRAPSAVILDIWLEGSRMDGLQVLAAIKAMRPNVPVVMISGHGTIATAVEAIKHGAYDFIEKPFQADRLLMVLGRALEAARLRRENLELRTRAGAPERLIGSCPPIAALRRTIERVGPTGSRVLISGPAGSGKEIVARQIHLNSPRASGPFVVVNCASLHPDRLAEMLFGGVKAQGEDSAGLLERADGGTLLLDEVGDMPLASQSSIIRILQDQKVERINAHGPVEVDVRVIATTNRDLRSEVKKGLFREELFYRLSVVPVQVPSLADRREDIPELARHLMDRAASAEGLPRRQLGEDAITALQAYPWPGNVRQLRNAINWLLILAPGGVGDAIRADMLPPEINSETPQMLKLQRSDEIMTLPLREAREMFEREYLMAQVIRYGGNISRTADFVGMERSALHRKLKSLGVSTDARRRDQAPPLREVRSDDQDGAVRPLPLKRPFSAS
ncbi:MAG: sigma-54-dependent Fis family transcriptional regulator [Rhodospirillaceae bacterium]|nr:sigma-54-dependent Fis family transcriptional regulator [Rhodospirillaceae bacterium]